MMAKEAAKSLLRAYAQAAVAGENYTRDYFSRSHLGQHGRDFGAYIVPPDHIMVTRLGDTEVRARFRLDDIWEELLCEARAGVQQLGLFDLAAARR